LAREVRHPDLADASNPQIPNPAHNIEAAKQRAGDIYAEYGRRRRSSVTNQLEGTNYAKEGEEGFEFCGSAGMRRDGFAQ